MSVSIDNGGPAFPNIDAPQWADTPGMMLRDWFAGQAILMPVSETQDVSKCDDFGLLERFGTEDEKERGFLLVSGNRQFIWNIELRATLEARARAMLRYAEADAMLAARKEPKP